MRCGLGAALISSVGLGCGEASEELRQIDEAPDLPPPADELEAAIRERAPTEAMLMIPYEDVVRGELARGERRNFTTVLRTGLCYKILGQGDSQVSDLDLFVYGPDGTLLQRDRTQSASPVIGVERAICPVEPAAYRIEVRMAEGSGTYGVQTWVSQ